jgi:Rab family protein
MEEEYDYLYKIVLVGDQGVGKTHILSRYIKNALPRNPQATIGVEFATSTVPLQTGGTVKAQIWDTAGQERYHAIVSAHYRRAVGALLVYDVTNHKTFQSTKRWIEELKKHSEPDIIIMLVGNKVDLCERNPIQRRVAKEEALALADAQGLLFLEASALTSYKVRECFEALLQEIYNRAQVVNSPQHQAEFTRLVPPVLRTQRDCCA